MSDLRIRGTEIEATFAEAFTMRIARLIVTARSDRWAREAALKCTGFATSVIGCKCEAGVERWLTPDETPDGRPGASILFMVMARDDLPKRLIERVGQTILTCPTTACYDGLPDAPDRVKVGSALRHFGDGFQASKVIGGKRYWRVPVMEGEFLVAEDFGMLKGVGGGNFLILAETPDIALEAAEAAVDAIAPLPNVILPFPGGVVRSGSKVGSRKSKTMIASTNDAFCPSLRAVTKSELPAGVNSVLELVINGIDAAAISAAMKIGIDAACRPGVIRISAGNYGGKLGPHHFHLQQIMGVEGTRMSGLTLTLLQPLGADADISALTAPEWQTLDAAALAARRVRVGRELHTVGDLFGISGAAGPSLTIRGDLAHAVGVAADLDAGSITVDGSVGDDAGIAMRGGVFVVHGSAGRNLGGARPGAKRGMTGGEILVHGHAGDEAGAAVRRGTIAIGGDAGARSARGGIAGTVYVAGNAGADTGLFLKRASVIVGGAAEIPTGFREACRYDPAYIRLLQRRLLALGFPLPAAQLSGTWRRFSGDAGEGALGELLLWTT